MITRPIIFDGKPDKGPEPEPDPMPFGLWSGVLKDGDVKEALRVDPAKPGEAHPTVVSPEAEAVAKRKPGRPRKATT